MVTASREVVGRVTCVAASVQAAHNVIVASGRSALTFNAAMSASSASTTIRSAFLLTLSPTVNCQDILAFLKAKLGCDERSSQATAPPPHHWD
jgi:hypothetical protein